MESNTSPNSRAARLSFLPLSLGLLVGVFVVAYAPQANAQAAVAPDSCAEDAAVHDDGDDKNGSDEDSVAVGCGAKVQQTDSKNGTAAARQNLYALDEGRDGTVDGYYVRVDCTNSEAGVCAERTGQQLVGISKTLHDRLKTVTDEVVETTGTDGSKVRTAGPLTEAELQELSTALTGSDDVRAVRATEASPTNRLTATGNNVSRSPSSETTEVADGTAIGGDATVKADGGVAIGNGANAGEDKTTTVTLTKDTDLGALVVGFEETTTGGGGENAIAIGNGASATGDGAIAIGNGSKATEDGQVVIGGHDISDMASNITSNTGKIDANTTKIDANTGKINTNTTRITENRTMINENKGKISHNGTRINENRGMIHANTNKIAMHDNMIDNAMTRLGNHDAVFQDHNARLVAHGATLAEHDSRLDTHDQVLIGHAAGISNNEMQIQMLDDRVSQAAAAAAALSAVPNAPGTEEQFFVGVGVGSHGGESSVAAGVSGRLGANRNIVVNAGIANSGDGTTIRAGVGWSF